MINRSPEKKLLRLAAAVTLAASLVSCQGKSTETTEAALPCGDGEIYPPGADEKPLLATTYTIEKPTAKACAVEIYIDGYKDVFLVIYSDRLEIQVFEILYGEFILAGTHGLPEEGKPIKFVYGGVIGEISVDESGNYTVWYDATRGLSVVGETAVAPGVSFPDEFEADLPSFGPPRGASDGWW